MQGVGMISEVTVKAYLQVGLQNYSFCMKLTQSVHLEQVMQVWKYVFVCIRCGVGCHFGWWLFHEWRGSIQPICNGWSLMTLDVGNHIRDNLFLILESRENGKSLLQWLAYRELMFLWEVSYLLVWKCVGFSRPAPGDWRCAGIWKLGAQCDYEEIQEPSKMQSCHVRQWEIRSLFTGTDVFLPVVQWNRRFLNLHPVNLIHNSRPA